MSVIRNVHDKISDAVPEFHVFYAREGFGSGKAVGRGEKVGNVFRRRRVVLSSGEAGHMRRALEKERHGHLQNVREVMQAARTDAIGALLVFLHLLERQPERLAKVLLAHLEHHPAHPHATADVLVGRIRTFLYPHVLPHFNRFAYLLE